MGRDDLMEFLDALEAMPEETAEEWKPEALQEAGPKEQAEAIKGRILDALKLGQDPGPILYSALECIGILTNDKAWAETGQGILSRIFGGLEQAELFRDDSQVIAERLEALADEQRAKTQAYLQRAISKAQKLQADAEKALKEIRHSEG